MCSVGRLCGWEAGASLVSSRDQGKWRPRPCPRLSPTDALLANLPERVSPGAPRAGWPPSLALAKRTCQDAESHVPRSHGPSARGSGAQESPLLAPFIVETTDLCPLTSGARRQVEGLARTEQTMAAEHGQCARALPSAASAPQPAHVCASGTGQALIQCGPAL